MDEVDNHSSSSDSDFENAEDAQSGEEESLASADGYDFSEVEALRPHRTGWGHRGGVLYSSDSSDGGDNGVGSGNDDSSGGSDDDSMGFHVMNGSGSDDGSSSSSGSSSHGWSPQGSINFSSDGDGDGDSDSDHIRDVSMADPEDGYFPIIFDQDEATEGSSPKNFMELFTDDGCWVHYVQRMGRFFSSKHMTPSPPLFFSVDGRRMSFLDQLKALHAPIKIIDAATFHYLMYYEPSYDGHVRQFVDVLSEHPFLESFVRMLPEEIACLRSVAFNPLKEDSTSVVRLPGWVGRGCTVVELYLRKVQRTGEERGKLPRREVFRLLFGKFLKIRQVTLNHDAWMDRFVDAAWHGWNKLKREASVDTAYLSEFWGIFLDALFGSSKLFLHPSNKSCLPLHLCMGKIPGHYAKEVRNEVLERHQEELTVKDSVGNTPFHILLNNLQLSLRDEWGCGHKSDMLDMANKMILTELRIAKIPDGSGKLPLHLAVEHGLTWGDTMKLLLDMAPRALETRDMETRFYPFMASAAIESHREKFREDSVLDTVYILLRKSPMMAWGLGNNPWKVEYEKVQSQCSTLLVEVEALRRETARARSENSALKAENTKLEAKNMALRNENSSLHDEMATLV